jgi:membrane associated rhomboid family serine protease
MARPNRLLERLSFGGRIPWGVGLVLTLTVVTSLSVALVSRHVLPLLELGALVPDRVLHGQIWRLLTWSVIEPGPLALVFGCLLLYFFGRDLAGEWGSRRFLAVYFGIALVAAVGTCIIAVFDAPLLEHPYVGSWPLAEAITVAWGLWFPDRVIRIYFVIPVRGLVLAWGTVALTVVFAIYLGWDQYVPNLLAEGAMLAWLHRGPVESRWSKWKRERETAARRSKTRAKQEQRMATVHVLHKLEESDDDLPPLPPEVSGKIDRIISDAARDQRSKNDDDKKS